MRVPFSKALCESFFTDISMVETPEEQESIVPSRQRVATRGRFNELEQVGAGRTGFNHL